MHRTYFKSHSRKGKKEKTERQRVIKANDDLFRTIIHYRDKVCQKTGKVTNLQVAHYYSRKNLRTRWDLDNACILNGGVHSYWAHTNYEQFREFWIKRIGKDRFEMLRIRAKYVAPVKLKDLYHTYYWLKQITENLETYFNKGV